MAERAASEDCMEGGAGGLEGEADFKFSPSPSLEQIREMQARFASERDWEKYHTPRNLLLALVGEVGELSEIFQWKGEVQPGLPGWTEAEREHVGQEMSDILIYLVRLAERCKVDLPAAVSKKFALNAQKYPAHKAYGSSHCDNSRMLMAERSTSQDHVREEASGPDNKEDFRFSPSPSLEEIRQLLARFASERDWEKYHTPRNLLLALVGEVGELSEIFQWKGEVNPGLPGWTEAEQEHVGQEMSDVLMNLVMMADKCKVDLPAAVSKKLALNAQKYPAHRSCEKYTTYSTDH